MSKGDKMERTVCELFAGVGGFRYGLNNINTIFYNVIKQIKTPHLSITGSVSTNDAEIVPDFA